MRALRFVVAAAALLMIGMSTAAQAAPSGAKTVEVTIQNFSYSPNPITIDKGDSIRWTNLDSASHSAVSVDPGFVSAVIGQGQSTTVTFNDAGTFEYVCAVHGASMKGTVIVRGTPSERTPAPVGPVGHLVNDQFAQARPDVFAATQSASAAIYVSALLALAAVARFVWVLRRG
jgi:plastocyanin